MPPPEYNIPHSNEKARSTRSKTFTREEELSVIQELWSRERQMAIEIVAEFARGHDDPDVNANINANIVRLVTHLFGSGSPPPFPSSLSDRAFQALGETNQKETLVNLFYKLFPEQAPRNVRLSGGPKNQSIFRHGDPLPRCLPSFMEFYGLLDGNAKMPEEIAILYQTKARPVRAYIGSVQRALRRHLRSI